MQYHIFFRLMLVGPVTVPERSWRHAQVVGTGAYQHAPVLVSCPLRSIDLTFCPPRAAKSRAAKGCGSSQEHNRTISEEARHAAQ